MIYTLTLNPALDRELVVPALDFDEVLRAREVRSDFGGKGLNVSRMLASLGAQSIALGFVGGHTGAALRAGLEGLGIANNFITVAGETRTNISIVAANRARHIKVNEPGPTISAAEQAALREQIRQLAHPGDWWVLAGSLPPGVPEAYYADLVRDIQAAGGYAVVDTSGNALREACAAKPFVAKPNAAEAGQFANMTVDSIEAAVAAAQAFAGIEHVVISLGKTGALLSSGGNSWLATPPSIQERNPIGAGDSMVAGFVWGLTQGDVVAALRWGIACGAATASQSGTTVGTYNQVMQLAEQVHIHSIE